MKSSYLLAGDIGGTKTNLAVFSPETGPRKPIIEATLESARYQNIEEMVREFLIKSNIQVELAFFGVAGPVIEGRSKITKLPWILDEQEIASSLGLKAVRLINDLVATGHAIPLLENQDVHTLYNGTPETHGTIAVLAPGTGLGEAFLVWDGRRYIPCGSEGGHADFAPSDKQEEKLLQYLREKFDHVSFDRICSGQGIPLIYDYLKKEGHAEEPVWLAGKLATADDPAPIIVENALAGENACELCVHTLNIFVSVLGAETGNLALKVLATGGIYIGGGIPPKILSTLQTDQFLKPFLNKGRLSHFSSRVPVHVILNQKAGLIGAAKYGLETIKTS